MKRLLFLFAIAAILSSCSEGFPPEFPAPQFTLKAPLAGGEISNSVLLGKPVAIVWFSSW